ncbi:arginine--tRNA ligase [Candidatus Micrarchaeota archaeon CG10_big_fil_rev_8_21_14_0_10_45_29]|nr:MAG: arginine--tRNA ligase [Candidatus Micrarchaeota archaeon CG10_big_fil_rev_8_21_14_0_10_45_29]
MEKELKEKIAKCLSLEAGVAQEEALASLCAPKGGQADLCSTLAFSVAKKERQNPAALCKKWAGAKFPSQISSVEAVGPYLNFYYSPIFWNLLVEKYAKKEKEIKSVPEKNVSGAKISKIKKRVIVEFPSVNPNKPWHAGHLRNALLGDCVSRILENAGNEVVRLDYIDDLGLQVAQSFWGQQNLDAPHVPSGGEKYASKSDHVCGWQYVEVAKKMDDEQVMREVREILHKLEEGNNEISLSARASVEAIVAAQHESAKTFGICHDALIFESDIMHTIFEKGMKKLQNSLTRETEGKNKGCLVVKLEGEEGFEGMQGADKVLIRSDGTATYTGKDVVFTLWKFGKLKNDFKYEKFATQADGSYSFMSCLRGKKMKFAGADIAVNVIGMEQAYPQKVISAVMQKIGYEKEASNFIHLAYEHVVLPSGKFSGRAGTWIGKDGQAGFSADELVDEVILRASERIKEGYSPVEREKISRAVGTAAIRFSFLRTSANQKIVFDIERALSLSGDSGPYVQYAYARACAILEKAKKMKVKPGKMPSGYKYNESEVSLLRLMLLFEEIAQKCAINYQVHPLCDFAIEAAGSFNKFYTSTPVLSDEAGEFKGARLLEVEAARALLGKCMDLLGIEKLEKM